MSLSSGFAVFRLATACCLAAVSATAFAAAPAAKPIPVRDTSPEELSELSLTQLMDIEITSVSRRAQPLRTAAAAVFVITGEEIRRAGVRTIADALRIVPGIQVRRSSAQSYTVTARGFSGDKLEVLLDGRSVYTPLTSTVFWDTLDTYLPDIERIEVIRGPGATLWGANAVNGVINIVTHDARNSDGTEVLAGGGNEELGFGAVRTGEALGADGAIRLFAQAHERDRTVHPDGTDSRDGGSYQQAGFRYDGALTSGQELQVLGDVYHGRVRSTGFDSSGGSVDTYTESRGASVQGQWSAHTRGAGDWSVDGSYTGYSLTFPTVFDEQRGTGELGLQHELVLGRQTVVWGAGARVSHDQTGGAPLLLYFDPQNRTLTKYNVYGQDQIRLGEGGELTLGTKLEQNTITGFEVQPGVRLGWALTPDIFTWGSVSRAVRTPNRIDSDVLIYCSFSGLTNPPCTQGESTRLGNPDLESEELIAYETGARGRFGSFTTDLAFYLNDYDKLRSTESGSAPFGTFANNLYGKSYGGELTLGWVPLDWLNLQASYALLKINLHARPGSQDTRSEATTEGGSPQQAATLRVALTPVPRLSVDTFLRYVDRLPAPNVPEYIELNLRAAWRLLPSLDLALVGENLLDKQHKENTATVELERSLFLELWWTLK